MCIESALIEHCSPTLASLKVGSLFCLMTPAGHDLQAQIRAANAQLSAKGLTLLLAKQHEDRALCYLYRASQLQSMLRDPDNAAFLRCRGYAEGDEHSSVRMLCDRIRMNDAFPHEVGLFLGYPLGDVIGFIENKGRNCLCCGCWKAYTDACAAKKLFARFNKCTEVYRRLYRSGSKTLSQLTVAA